MFRTRDLITAIAASCLVTGASAHAQPVAQGAGKPGEVSTKADDWKTDPDVRKAADTIFGFLKDSRSADAKTLPQVREHFVDLSASMVEDGLRYLLYDGRIRRRGAGTKESPYLYYEINESHGG